MFRVHPKHLMLALLCAASFAAVPATADISQPNNSWSPPGDYRSPPAQLPKTNGSSSNRAFRIQRENGLARIAGELNDQMPSDASGSQRARRSIYDPSSGRQQIQQSKRIVRRRPGGAQAPAPGALALAALGVVMVVRLKKSFS